MSVFVGKLTFLMKRNNKKIRIFMKSNIYRVPGAFKVKSHFPTYLTGPILAAGPVLGFSQTLHLTCSKYFSSKRKMVLILKRLTKVSKTVHATRKGTVQFGPVRARCKIRTQHSVDFGG